MKTANERLAEARLALGFDRKAEFAEHVGIERSTYDKMEKGPNKPSAENLERIITRYPALSLNWLLTGAGEMLLSTDNQLPPPVPSQAPATPGLPLRVNRDGEDETYWKQIAVERANTIELLKQLLSTQFPALAEQPGKLVNSEYAAAELAPVGFQQAGRRPSPLMFVATGGHRLAWVDAALGQPLTVEAMPLKKSA